MRLGALVPRCRHSLEMRAPGLDPKRTAARLTKLSSERHRACADGATAQQHRLEHHRRLVRRPTQPAATCARSSSACGEP
eukprot:7700979-Heterocapsa_arctica.AAC.1